MADFRAIMSLVFKDRSYRQIVEAVGCSHRDVSSVRMVIRDRGITAARLAGMSDAELAGLFPDGRSGVSSGYDGPDFARVVASMRSNPHFTLLQACGVAMSDRSRTCASTGIRSTATCSASTRRATIWWPRCITSRAERCSSTGLATRSGWLMRPGAAPAASLLLPKGPNVVAIRQMIKHWFDQYHRVAITLRRAAQGLSPCLHRMVTPPLSRRLGPPVG